MKQTPEASEFQELVQGVIHDAHKDYEVNIVWCRGQHGKFDVCISNIATSETFSKTVEVKRLDRAAAKEQIRVWLNSVLVEPAIYGDDADV